MLLMNSDVLKLTYREVREILSGPAENLTDLEKGWRDRLPWFERCGYTLRPRYQPGWTPSWIASGKKSILCEDAVKTFVC